MSISTFKTTNVTVTSMTMASTTGKSSRRIASTIALPSPGTRKICSTTSEPPINAPVFTPKIVMNENSDGRSACLNNTAVLETPLDRAVRMKSSCRVVMRSVRNNRWYTAPTGSASVNAGRTIVFTFVQKGSVALKVDGKMSYRIDRTYLSTTPRANTGIAIKPKERTVEVLSTGLFARDAAKIAQGIAIKVANN